MDRLTSVARRALALSGLTATTLLLSGCPDLGRHFSDQDEALFVDFYQQQCATNSPDLCFRVRKSEDDSFAVTELPLSGFSGFAWGTRYDLMVETSFDNNGRDESYRFLSITDSEVQSGSNRNFALDLYTQAGILTQGADNTSWMLAGIEPFSCSGDDCTQISAAVASSEVIRLNFVAENNALTLSSVGCRASENDFSSDCQGETNERWFISHFQSDCGNSTAQMCLLFRQDENGDPSRLTTTSGAITNFTYQWGNGYEMNVDVVRNNGQISEATLATADDSPTNMANSEEDFLMVIRTNNLSDADNGVIALYDSAPSLNCEMHSLCDTFNAATDDDEYLLVRGYVESLEDDAQIIATVVECREEAENIEAFNQCVRSDNDVSWW